MNLPAMRKTYLILFISMLAAICTQAQNPKKEYKLGLEFFDTKNYSDAINQFTKAIELKTDYVDAYVKRGDAYEALDETQKAVDDYRRALAFEDKDEEIYFKTGIACFKLEQDSLSTAMFKTAISLKKNYSQVYPNLIKIYLRNKQFDQALGTAQEWEDLKSTAIAYYYIGVAHDSLESPDKAISSFSKAISIQNNFVQGYISKSRAELKLDRLSDAYSDINKALSYDKNNVEAFILKSEIGVAKNDFPNAINDISRAIVIEPENVELYQKRGLYNMKFSQYANAIADFNKMIILQKDNPEGYYYRAQANAETGNIEHAISDYQRFEELSPGVAGLDIEIEDAKKQLYELNKESNNPELILTNPKTKGLNLNISKGSEMVLVSGNISDQSLINKIEVNGITADFDAEIPNPSFTVQIPIKEGENEIKIVATDVYFNVLVRVFQVDFTEVNPPKVVLRAPVASDNNVIFLDNDSPEIYIEGQILDESGIKLIRINDRLASYVVNEHNPVFSATVNVANKNTLTVYSEDSYGNSDTIIFTINRESIGILADNPMGKTWVVFIENSNYQEFASLDGPEKDVSEMRASLTNYKINNFIHKKDMTKEQMERFFAIELRDLVRSNQVHSILIWYAGHGKFINQTGYWIPVNAKRDDEFTYFNVNFIKTSLQSYYSGLTHTLVINDACESGASFADLTRGEKDDRRCDSWQDISSKSSQVFTSAGYELAIDNSQFTKTFANSLSKNTDTCIPIDVIVRSVKTSVVQNNKQTPQFGIISGLGDENGTFFFIKK